MTKSDKVKLSISSEDIEKLKSFNFGIYDFLIMLICARNPHSITELQRELNIAYKNLYPHIKKLQEIKFIEIKDFGKGNKKQITTIESKYVDNFISAFSLLFNIKIIEEK